MVSKMENAPNLREQLISGLQRENDLQSKIIEQQRLTIETLEYLLQK